MVNDHDFNKYAKGKVFPYGLFDELRYEGFVYVGQSLWDQKGRRFVSSETPEFAAESVARYWNDYGIRRYQNSNKILIWADAGGSNGYRARKNQDGIDCQSTLGDEVQGKYHLSKWHPEVWNYENF